MIVVKGLGLKARGFPANVFFAARAKPKGFLSASLIHLPLEGVKLPGFCKRMLDLLFRDFVSFSGYRSSKLAGLRRVAKTGQTWFWLGFPHKLVQGWSKADITFAENSWFSQMLLASRVLVAHRK